jgi:hypothetical protein
MKYNCHMDDLITFKKKKRKEKKTTPDHIYIYGNQSIAYVIEESRIGSFVWSNKKLV